MGQSILRITRGGGRSPLQNDKRKHVDRVDSGVQLAPSIINVQIVARGSRFEDGDFIFHKDLLKFTRRVVIDIQDVVNETFEDPVLVPICPQLFHADVNPATMRIKRRWRGRPDDTLIPTAAEASFPVIRGGGVAWLRCRSAGRACRGCKMRCRSRYRSGGTIRHGGGSAARTRRNA